AGSEADLRILQTASTEPRIDVSSQWVERALADVTAPKAEFRQRDVAFAVSPVFSAVPKTQSDLRRRRDRSNAGSVWCSRPVAPASSTVKSGTPWCDHS